MWIRLNCTECKNIMIVSKNELKCHYLKAQSINPSLLSHSYGVAALTKK